MSSPYFTAKPGDTLLSQQWNEIQIRLRDEILSHTHAGGDQGTKIAADGIDPTTALTVQSLSVTGSLSVGNPVQLFVDGSGHVGIGTTAPGNNRLKVSGVLRADTISTDKVTTSVLEGVTQFAVGAFKADSVTTPRVTAGRVEGVNSLKAQTISADNLTVGNLTAASANIERFLATEMTFSLRNGGERLRVRSDGALVTGTLTVTGAAAWGANGTRTEVRSDAGLQGNAGARSGCFETNNPVNFPGGATKWWHLLDVRHSNPANNYAMQLAGSFYDQALWFRKTNGNPAQPWLRVLTTADLKAGLTLYGPLVPKVGGGGNAGIQFPKDPGGGSGDQAYIKYSVTTGEACKLVVAIENDANDALIFRQGGANRVIISNKIVRIDGNTGLFVGGKLIAASDARKKRDIASLDGALDKVLRVRGVRFRWAEPGRPEGPEIGLLAQDVEAVFPEVVQADPSGVKGVDYARLVAPLIEALREQQAQIEALRTEVRALSRS